MLAPRPKRRLGTTTPDAFEIVGKESVTLRPGQKKGDPLRATDGA
jgi:hypothetical protein